MASPVHQPRVAVIGLGIAGVGALKNLLEEGFDAVGFERNNHIGGLWHWNEDPDQVTVLKTTKANISKQRSCYTDFEFPKDVGFHPSAEEIAQYIRDYAEHFKLMDHCRLGTQIKRIERIRNSEQWSLQISDKSNSAQIEVFDRVIIASGQHSMPNMPVFPGAESFKGRILHSRAFKDAKDFSTQKVIVVGLSNTAGDVAVDLADENKKVYVSHRSGNRVLARIANGVPMDHQGTRRLTDIAGMIGVFFPTLVPRLFTLVFDKNMRRAYPNLNPAWKLLPAPPFANAPPMVNDRLIGLLESERIVSLPGIKSFMPDGHSIEFTDGTIIEKVDAVVVCTGYGFDYSVLADEVRPTSFPFPEWDAHPNKNNMAFARLYQGIFSTKYADSLAFLGPYKGHSFTAFGNADLASQAIAQVWKGNYALPSQREMDAWCDKVYRHALGLLEAHHIDQIGSDMKALEIWLNDAAGNNVNELLGWGWKGWNFWWNNRKLYKLLIDGIDTPFTYRLFDSSRGDKGRKKWAGAQDAILRANNLKSLA